MSATPREIGTLIVVVLKANHLPNKRQIGKQSPYCSVTVNGEKRRTRAIKKGGQHPEWDEEIRFTLYEDTDDILARTANGDAPPPPPKEGKAKKLLKVKGGKTMKVACYAEDAREPEIIGETDVDLTEVLTKGETDEWFTLTHKDKFAGKVYLELTFWSNEPPPEKKLSSKPLKSNKLYGGPGDFVPQGESPASSMGSHTGRIVSAGVPYDHSRLPSDSMSHLRPSSSMAQLDYLYQPPYEQQGRASAMDRITSDFGQFGMMEPGRRESFPPQHSYSSTSISSSYSYGDPNAPPQGMDPYGQPPPPVGPPSSYAYSRPETRNDSQPPSSAYHRHSISGPRPSFLNQAPYQPPYEAPPPQGPPPSLRPARGPRTSIPASSSGFVPLSSSSSFSTLASHLSESSGFVSRTPAPAMYNPSHFNPPAGFPLPSQTPMPGYAPPVPPSASSSFNGSLPFPSSQSYQYQPYLPPPTAPPQGYMSQGPEGVPPQPVNGYSQHTESPEQHTPPPPPPLPSTSIPPSGSRPLPQQPSLPPFPISHSNQQISSFTPPRAPSSMYPPANGYNNIPPPPAPPTLRTSPGPEGVLQSPHSPHVPHQQYTPPQEQHQQWSAQDLQQQDQRQPSLPPPPPPPQQVQSGSPRRQSSLPPVNPNPYHPLPAPPPPPSYFHGGANGNLPPPPPPPPMMSDYGQPPPPQHHAPVDYGQQQPQHQQQQPYFPGPPPKPPPMPFEQAYPQQPQQQWA